MELLNDAVVATFHQLLELVDVPESDVISAVVTVAGDDGLEDVSFSSVPVDNFPDTRVALCVWLHQTFIDNVFDGELPGVIGFVVSTHVDILALVVIRCKPF